MEIRSIIRPLDKDRRTGERSHVRTLPDNFVYTVARIGEHQTKFKLSHDTFAIMDRRNPKGRTIGARAIQQHIALQKKLRSSVI